LSPQAGSPHEPAQSGQLPPAELNLRDASVDGRGLQSGASDMAWPELQELINRPHHS
jgi:hypothetical protein